MDDAMKCMEQPITGEVRAEMGHRRADLWTETSRLRSELPTEIEGLRAEMALLRADWKRGLAAVREERQAFWRTGEWLMLMLMALVFINLGIRIATVL